MSEPEASTLMTPPQDPHTCFAWFTFLCCHPICGAFALAHSWDVERANQFGHQATAQAISQVTYQIMALSSVRTSDSQSEAGILPPDV